MFTSRKPKCKFTHGGLAPPYGTPQRICLSSLRLPGPTGPFSLKTGHWPVFRALRTPGGKSARYVFLLRRSGDIFTYQLLFCSAKILLAAYMPPLRIIIRGKNPPDHPLWQASDPLLIPWGWKSCLSAAGKAPLPYILVFSVQKSNFEPVMDPSKTWQKRGSETEKRKEILHAADHGASRRAQL